MKRLLPLTLMLLSCLVGYAYQVTISGFVAGHGGDGVANAAVLIYSSPNDGFRFEETVTTNERGHFEIVVDVPNDILRGVLFVSIKDCPSTQIKRVTFDPSHTRHQVRLQSCRDSRPDCKVEIVARLLDDQQVLLKAVVRGTKPFTYEWSSGESTPEIIVSERKEYCIVITDSTGCNARDCIDLTASNCAVEIHADRANADAVSGTILLQARVKGRAPFSYEWSTGDTTKNIKIEQPGEYCVKVTDALGCEARDCIKVDSTDLCRTEIHVLRTDLAGNGLVTLIARSIGRPPFSYRWSTGDTTQRIEAEPQGEYCVTVVDASGCVSRDCLNFDRDGCAVEIHASRGDASTVDGFLVLHARAKGRAPFSYRWSTGDTTKNIKVMDPGEYCVTIVDATGCEARDCISLDPHRDCKTEIQVAQTDVANDGLVLLIARTIGREPYTYRWSTGDTTQSIRVEPKGKYCVKVVDSAQCHSGDCIDFDQRDCGVQIHARRSHPQTDTGSIALHARAKGRAPFKYRWSTGDTTNTIMVREMGEYCVTIVDAAGCEARDCIDLQIRDECATQIQIARQSNDPAAGLVLVARTKGHGPFSYRWSTGDTTQTIVPTDTADYCVEVVDATGCVSSDCIDLARLNDSCAVEIRSSSTGVLVAVTRGMPHVKYLWSTGETTKQIRVTKPGEYCVTITTVFGCEAMACIQVGERDSLCRVSIHRRRADNQKVQLVARVEGLGDYEFLWSTGDTTKSIVVDTSGKYCVTAFSAHCKTEDCIRVNIGSNGLAIGDAVGQNNKVIFGPATKVFPNPFQHQVNLSVDINSAGAGQIVVLRVDGKMLVRKPVVWTKGSNIVSLDLHYLDAGLYFVRLQSTTETLTKRIMKSE